MNILVIGNGFDLAHGLPTKYTDFLEVVESFNSIITNPDIIRQGTLASIAKPKYKFLDRLIFEEPLICKEFEEQIRNNFWINYFFLDPTYQKENWIDFESEISKVIRVLDDARVLTMQGGSVLSIEDTRIDVIKNILKASSMKVEGLFSGIEKIDKFVDRCKKDLKRLTRALKIYLCEYVEKSECVTISSDIKDICIDKVLSFNYTNTFTKIYDKNENLKYDYIHGKADICHSIETNNMVLGIDEYLPDERKNKDVDMIEFKKFYQRIYKETGCKYKEWVFKIQQDASIFQGEYLHILNRLITGIDAEKYRHYEKYIHHIYIFGHSLDDTDGDILRELILNDNVLTTIFYFDKKQNGKQIANLVKVIGQDELIKRTGGGTKTIEFKLQQDMVGS